MGMLLTSTVLFMFLGLSLLLMAKDDSSLCYGVAKLMGASFFIVASMIMGVTVALQRLGLGG